ncbi:PspC domain-containing protein [Propionicicella superfundia]|uniref:PspC domain-containing protein n=1 Tax=Propionicicella superfundia TaxID=348582 RepID=UPI0004240C5B|nr:PspC domain-containing protein [Propionicicella superfundia]
MGNMPLTRVPEGKMIAGVCTGLAKYLNLDVSLVRLITVLLAVFTQVGWVVYIVLWLVVPEDSSGRTGVDSLKDTFAGSSDKTYQQYPGSQPNGPQDPPPAA